LAKSLGDRAGALEHSRAAAHIAPGSKAWYNLGYDLLYMNRPMEARDALLQLDPDNPPMKGWYGYFGVLASSHHLLGDFEEELAVTREARKRFPERRAALVIQAQALAALGRTEGLEELFADAAAMPGATADNSVGAIMTMAAAELKAHGYDQAGDALYSRAVAWYEEAGEAVATRPHLTWAVTALIGAQSWQDAADSCEKQLAVDPDDIWCHSSIATMALKLGDRARFEAEKAYFQREAPNRPPTFLPNYMSFLEVADGNVEKGVALLEEAMSLGTGFSIWWHRYPGMEDQMAHPAYQEFLRPKG
jgi:tetratricopeptide (TPR) repeat protein